MPGDEEPALVEDLPAMVQEMAEPIVLRPGSGYWWHALDGQSFGPFASWELAYADMHTGDPDDLEPGESVQEAESELGISDWIDPDTGEPAEGQATPHIDRD
jgi:hypothetical protein